MAACSALEADDFIASLPRPGDFDKTKENVERFVAYHTKEGNKLAFVTSGGTMVPLEMNTVRYLDNFSTGSRGAISAEQFISNGYAVIFLHRSTSLLPYHRILTPPKLDSLEVNPNGDVIMTTGEAIKPVWSKYKMVVSSNRLLLIGYNSLFDYVHYLQLITKLVNNINSVVYLAAAVSDYYIPPEDMSEHKISSSSLKLELQKVPKLLGIVNNDWGPLAYVVSFKLETDSAVLSERARNALRQYGHQLVIANTLSTRKSQLLIIERDKEEVPIVLTPEEAEKGRVIEEKLVEQVCKRHDVYIDGLS